MELGPAPKHAVLKAAQSIAPDVHVHAGKVAVSLSWTTVTTVDLDVSAVLCNEAGNVIDAVYYNKLSACDSAIQHSGDVSEGNLHGEDSGEMVTISLTDLPKAVTHVLFLINSHAEDGFNSVESGSCYQFVLCLCSYHTALVKVMNVDRHSASSAFHIATCSCNTHGDHQCMTIDLPSLSTFHTNTW